MRTCGECFHFGLLGSECFRYPPPHYRNGQTVDVASVGPDRRECGEFKPADEAPDRPRELLLMAYALEVLDRLGNMEAFQMARMIDRTGDTELLARIDFARAAAIRIRGPG